MKNLHGAVIGVFGLLMMSLSLGVRDAVPHEAFASTVCISVLLVVVGMGSVWMSGRRDRSRRR